MQAEEKGRMSNPVIVLFQNDLRIEDQPALFKAANSSEAVIPLFIYDEEGESFGGASKWWLYHSLSSLKNDLADLGLSIVIRKGDLEAELFKLVHETKAKTVYWNRRYDPHSIKVLSRIKSRLKEEGIQAESFNASLLYEPWTIANKEGRPFQVFTPFWKSCLKHQKIEKPLGHPKNCLGFSKKMATEEIEHLGLLPKIHWDAGFQKSWKPGTKGALQHLKEALEEVVLDYSEKRDFPSVQGTSKLSPFLHFGEISPKMIWNAVVNRYGDDPASEPFLRQLGWREFAHHLLYHFPHTINQPLRKPFEKFPWNEDQEELAAWQKGKTGYPIVDAGMRELWTTGWMHNRVRMIVGSFLVKDLLISWQQGAAWFWDTLVDADLANNTLGWQWVGGCGADAAPYFRIFNPITQGKKFDTEGDYVRKWVPEIKQLPNKWIHDPWNAPSDVLRSYGVILGVDYPHPIVDHDEARKKALEAFYSIREEE